MLTLAAWTNLGMFLNTWVREMIAALIRVKSKTSQKYQFESFIAHVFQLCISEHFEVRKLGMNVYDSHFSFNSALVVNEF